ncbi:MAG: hypothetical protein ACKV2T_32550 [Kofleriaceae bacterium]
MSFTELLANEKTDYLIVATQIAGPRKLFAALELFAFADKSAATVIVSIDLDTLAAEIVYEIDGETADYRYVDGWHGLVQAKRVIELEGGTPRVTKTRLAGEEEACHAIARHDGKTFVAGTKQSPSCKYVIDGFVAEVTGGKLAIRVETSQLPNVEEGHLDVLCAGSRGLHASGSAMTSAPKDDDREGIVIDLEGKTPTLRTCIMPIYALHETASGDLLLGSDKRASVIGKATRTFDVPSQVRAVTEFRGTAYFASHNHKGSTLHVYRGTSKGAEPAWKAKFQWIGYRSRGGRRDLKMCASADLLVVSNETRLHIYDGKKWSQLAVTREPGKLVKRMPVGMK